MNIQNEWMKNDCRMSIRSVQINFSFSCYSITEKIQDFLDTTQKIEGVVCARGKHTTIAFIITKMKERVIIDLEKWLKKLSPILQAYKQNNLHFR